MVLAGQAVVVREMLARVFWEFVEGGVVGLTGGAVVFQQASSRFPAAKRRVVLGCACFLQETLLVF